MKKLFGKTTISDGTITLEILPMKKKIAKELVDILVIRMQQLIFGRALQLYEIEFLRMMHQEMGSKNDSQRID